MSVLIPINDADFDWLAGIAPATRDLTIPPGGAEDPNVLPIIRRIAQRLHAANYPGSWMMVANNEVVGLCNFIRPPADGVVELGYGVAATRRNRGHATAAVAAMLDAARSDPTIMLVYAETATTNPASARALVKNGFVEISRRDDPEDGTLIRWEKPLTV
jgi:RimJ/RimL family protein N-acetyltransferase